MEKKTKKVLENTGRKKSDEVKFDLHIGKMIKDYIDYMPGLSQAEFIKAVKKSHTVIIERFKSPYYGTTYDLIEACIVCRKDFISPMMMVLKHHDIKADALGHLEELYTLRSRSQTYENQIKRLEKDNDLLHEYIEKLKNDTKNK